MLEFWLIFFGFLPQFVGVFILTCVEYLNFEWILDRVRRNSFEMVRDEEERKFKRRRTALVIGFGLILGGIGWEIINATLSYKS